MLKEIESGSNQIKELYKHSTGNLRESCQASALPESKHMEPPTRYLVLLWEFFSMLQQFGVVVIRAVVALRSHCHQEDVKEHHHIEIDVLLPQSCRVNDQILEISN